MRSQHGVAVGVLRVHALQGQPATDVVPPIGGLHHEHFLRVLHHCIVDADPLQRFIFMAEDRSALGR